MNQTTDSFKTFAVWLAALFLTALGAQLWIAWLYGSPLLLWDQWYEAPFIKAWVTGQWTLSDFVAAHNEHRIFATRALEASLVSLNGRWEPMVEMTANAFLHAALACLLAFCLWEFFGRKNGWLMCFLVMPFFALPIAGENAIWGINSLYDFLDIFTLLTLAILGFVRFGGNRLWWLGCLAAVVGLFTIASGLLAPVAVGGLIVLRMLKARRFDKSSMTPLNMCFALFSIGVALNVTKQEDKSFQAHSFLEFSNALVRNLSWPFYHAPEMPVLIALPLIFLLVTYLRPNFPAPRAAEFILVLALWAVLQAVAIAYGRANYGGSDVPAPRYADMFQMLVIAAVFATVLLAQSWERYPIRGSLLALTFTGLMLYGMCRISLIVVDDLLAQTRMWNLVAEERVQRFMATGHEADLLERPTVRPDPGLAMSVLRDPALQNILPAVCLPPSRDPKAGRLSPLSQWLQEHSPGILSAGLILFIALCGFGLARGTPGLPQKSPVGVLALLAGLAALGFVWSKHAVTRRSVEYELQQQIADNFKAAGNLKRAAIHEQKAEALKP
ncbi:MAG TPA: hypothetical protein VNU95_00350 [Candidatus Acidoferrales bacterium]|nr:hypothetical protein [Candidatus Acidoferrales bacterium]